MSNYDLPPLFQRWRWGQRVFGVIADYRLRRMGDLYPSAPNWKRLYTAARDRKPLTTIYAAATRSDFLWDDVQDAIQIIRSSDRDWKTPLDWGLRSATSNFLAYGRVYADQDDFTVTEVPWRLMDITGGKLISQDLQDAIEAAVKSQCYEVAYGLIDY